ncbi:MAG: hypothetical protein ACON41_02880 [Parvibaculales bacterium]
MADEKDEFRKMAEIADAIQTILDDESPQTSSQQLPQESSEETSPPETQNQDAIEDTSPLEVTDAQPEDDTGPDAGLDAGLEAAIAAELSGESDLLATDSPSEAQEIAEDEASDSSDMTIASDSEGESEIESEIESEGESESEIAGNFGGDFGGDFGAIDTKTAPAQVLSSADTPPQTAETDSLPTPQAVTETSPPAASGTISDHMKLSLDMRDLLSNLQNNQNTHETQHALMTELEQAQKNTISQMRDAIAKAGQSLPNLKAHIEDDMRKIEQDIIDSQHTIERLAIEFDAKIQDIHQRYQANFNAEQRRIDRYQDFIEFLLREKNK